MPRGSSFDSKMGGKRAENPMKTLLRLMKYYRECKVQLVIALIGILVYSAATTLTYYMLDPLVAVLEAGTNADTARYAALLIGMGALYAIGCGTNFLFNRLMLSCSARIMCAMRKEMFAKMQKLPVSFFDGHTHGELMSYYTNDIDAVREMVQNSITQMLISVTSLIAYIGMMLYLSVSLFFVAIVMCICIYYVIKIIGGKSRKNFQKQQKALSRVNGYIEEMMEGQKVVKVFNHEKAGLAAFEAMNDELCTVATDANTFANIVGPIMNNLSHIFYALICTVGLQYVRQFANRISQISQQFNSILLALAGAERVFALIDLPSEPDEGTVTLVRVEEKDGKLAETARRTGKWAWKRKEELIPLRGDVRFTDVDFSYDGKKQVLNNVTLYAYPGQKIAFVGSTGAGKTTITNLINRFYDITDGTITYDGIPIREIKKDDLRHSLGMVLQDTHLFTGTVMENIRYGRLDATDEDCIRAAKIANAHFFISHLPEGYNTQLVADGANLSQGQRQLISIARAAVSDPPVLILDEATSSIDTRTEKLIEKGMDALMKGRTVFVIAHRLSTVRNADCIMVLEHGEIIERGEHDALLAQKGKYYQLHTGAFELS